ncbi:CHASE2 domain-containing protein [Phormidium sp. CCY1219]|uniref:CHASE2 domain-containing protein n=1 Tax=Phormidium sp. CCY1219 TaxID=2886104 RepID=UPI002D1EECCE|nr:CHASE2 domain-containing protein [Phormidium sp. CCY1219]MEB3831931.1 CHASE2 domain-containing protein [Phormidium sp. CCY1219]
MGKLVKLSLEGEIESGYQVELIEISEEQRDGKILVEGISGTLPPAEEIYHRLQNWQENYAQLDLLFRGEFRFLDSDNFPNVSLVSCQQIAEKLQEEINTWFDFPGFRPIEDKIRTILNPFEDIRFLVKTSDRKLWQLPWSAWEFFESYPNAEVVFSSFDARYGEKPVKLTPRKNVRILAVFGEDSNLNTHPDRDQIERLKSLGAEPTSITEPSVQHLRNLLWEKSWDIFFFAGHGEREESIEGGKIFLNQTEELTPSEFKNTLKTAIVDRGLKIVFLNSCLGLEFAYELVTEFGIPVAIAMREPIPDGAAQKFLEYFLLEYADNGRPLHVAVRKAKERIAEESQTEYPCLDWLPVVCQNPATIPPKWRDLHRKVSWKQAGMASVGSGCLVMLLRCLGVLQPLELAGLDYLMRLRPPEAIDPRLVVVTVTAEDLNYYNQDPLTDKIVERLLSKLIQYKPRVIGLDIFRDFPQPPGDEAGQKQLIEVLSKPKHPIFAICRVRETQSSDARNIGVGPPPNFPRDRLGFADVLEDSDGIIRRQLLTMSIPSEDPCETPFSLNFQLARVYLEGENIYPKQTKAGDLVLGDVLFKRLHNREGGYQNIDDVGYQIMTNYRSPDRDNNITQTVTLKEVLTDNIDADLIKDRIVLIGYTAEIGTGSDFLPTPYDPRTPGAMVQAHMVSQMVSAVLDGRPLLWNLPSWGNFVWVFGWSCFGGFFIWRIQRLWRLAIAGGSLLIVVFSLSFLSLWLHGAWMPLIPSMLALVTIIGGYAILLVYISVPHE